MMTLDTTNSTLIRDAPAFFNCVHEQLVNTQSLCPCICVLLTMYISEYSHHIVIIRNPIMLTTGGFLLSRTCLSFCLQSALGYLGDILDGSGILVVTTTCQVIDARLNWGA